MKTVHLKSPIINFTFKKCSDSQKDYLDNLSSSILEFVDIVSEMAKEFVLKENLHHYDIDTLKTLVEIKLLINSSKDETKIKDILCINCKCILILRDYHVFLSKEILKQREGAKKIFLSWLDKSIYSVFLDLQNHKKNIQFIKSQYRI